MPSIPRIDRLKIIYSAAKQLNFANVLQDFPSAPPFTYNGVTGYRPQLHRVTIRFCKQSENSVGLRRFVEKHMTQFAKENPTCVVYALPMRNTTPTLRAEYSNGRMVHLNATSMTEIQVQLHMNNLRTRSGQPIVKFEAFQTAQCRSIQGEWSPMTWADTKQNAAEQLPQPEFSKARRLGMWAQKYVLENTYEQLSDEAKVEELPAD